MTMPASFLEEECFNVYWKIKNFSFCREINDSPVFSFSGKRYFLRLSMEINYAECRLLCSPGNSQSELAKHISVLTCDGTPENSISGCNYVNLRVPRDVIFGKRRSSFLPDDTLTVRFRTPTTTEKGKFVICSQIGVRRKYFLWTHKNFSNCDSYLEKSVETCERYGDIKLILKSTHELNNEKHLFIEISRQRGERCHFILKVSIIDVNGKSQNEIGGEFVFGKTDGQQQTKALTAFFRKSKLLAYKNLLLPNDTLSLKCNFAMSFGSLAVQTSSTSYCKDVESFVRQSDNLSMTVKEKNDYDSGATLQTDLKSILDDGMLFDVTLQIDTEVIKVHKNILSARSLVFKSMFTKDMKEAINSTVTIEDLDVATVRRLLLYIYTDSMNDE